MGWYHAQAPNPVVLGIQVRDHSQIQVLATQEATPAGAGVARSLNVLELVVVMAITKFKNLLQPNSLFPYFSISLFPCFNPVRAVVERPSYSTYQFVLLNML